MVLKTQKVIDEMAGKKGKGHKLREEEGGGVFPECKMQIGRGQQMRPNALMVFNPTQEVH